MRDQIQSESKFFWKFIWHIILTPFTFILIILRKREFKDLFSPFKELFRFIAEPKFTLFIIIANIAMYIISIFMSEEVALSLITYPTDLFSVRIYSLITSGFLHANLSHLLWNMLGIFIFGRIVEKKLGATKTAGVYFAALIISGIFAALINLFIIPNNIGSLGASGALMGLVSAAILLSPFYITYEFLIPLPAMVVGWITLYADIVGILNPTNDGIGHFAHLGGFISIAILVFFFSGEDKHSLKKGLIINLISLIVLLGLYFLLL